VNNYIASGEVSKRHGTGGAVIVPYQTFDTADRPLCLAPGNDRLWARCAAVLGHPEWATDPRYAKSAARVKNKAELLPLIAAVMRTQTRAQWLEALETAGVPCSPVNDVGELAETEQFAASELVQELPGGGPKVVGLPISFDRVRPTSARPAPKLGEHTDEVLREAAE
jgi:crotonobetainyl-CoA:carnitine CoA-transferase CaiB-like acyl-CoA transferase